MSKFCSCPSQALDADLFHKANMAATTWDLTTVYATALIIFLYFVASTAYQSYRLRKVPGPFLARFSYIWLSWTMSKGQDTVFHQLGEKYGRLVLVGPELLLTDDPEQLRKM